MSQGQKDAQRSASPPTGLRSTTWTQARRRVRGGSCTRGQVPCIHPVGLRFRAIDGLSFSEIDKELGAGAGPSLPRCGRRQRGTGDRQTFRQEEPGPADGTPTLQGSNHFRGRYISESASPLKISGNFSTPFLPTYADFGVNKGEGDFSVYFLANKAVFRRAQ